MKRSRLILGGVVLVALAGAAYLVFGRSAKDADAGPARVKVTRENIIDKALAVGTIEPENEISVKSKVSGVVSRIFADAGAFVKAGQPLLEVKPDPTPLELADAKRQVQLREVEMVNLTKEKVRQESLKKKDLSSDREFEEFERRFNEAQLQLKITRERLALLESGKVTIENTHIESIIKAPIDGYVLSKTVEVGDPVTPLTSYQEGTVLMKMANMERLVFKGTVDEIDVGRLREGMDTELKVGALPLAKIAGTLSRISLKAEKKEAATVFPIEITVPRASNATLRAGYSANANIFIQRKDSVLTIPERCVTFRNDSAFVKVPAGAGGEEERLITTGLSDAIRIEVLTGLALGQEILEKPVKKIE
jgi:HlyD family secretion protein